MKRDYSNTLIYKLACHDPLITEFYLGYTTLSHSHLCDLIQARCKTDGIASPHLAPPNPTPISNPQNTQCTPDVSVYVLNNASSASHLAEATSTSPRRPWPKPRLLVLTWSMQLAPLISRSNSPAQIWVSSLSPPSAGSQNLHSIANRFNLCTFNTCPTTSCSSVNLIKRFENSSGKFQVAASDAMAATLSLPSKIVICSDKSCAPSTLVRPRPAAP